jgi:hypothetical protein
MASELNEKQLKECTELQKQHPETDNWCFLVRFERQVGFPSPEEAMLAGVSLRAEMGLDENTIVFVRPLARLKRDS